MEANVYLPVGIVNTVNMLGDFECYYGKVVV